MSDDIREVMKPTPFSPAKRTGPTSDRHGGAAGHSGRSSEEEPPEEPELSEKEMNVLLRDIEAANDRLAAAGRDVHLGLLEGPGSPVIEILIRDEGGPELVTRRVAPGEIDQWVARLESGEGIIIDDML